MDDGKIHGRTVDTGNPTVVEYIRQNTDDHGERDMAKNFPLFVDVSNKKMIVYGAGKIASRRVETLLAFAPSLTVHQKHRTVFAERLNNICCITGRNGIYQDRSRKILFLCWRQQMIRQSMRQSGRNAERNRFWSMYAVIGNIVIFSSRELHPGEIW